MGAGGEERARARDATGGEEGREGREGKILCECFERPYRVCHRQYTDLCMLKLEVFILEGFSLVVDRLASRPVPRSDIPALHSRGVLL